jgi:hypothetical protein
LDALPEKVSAEIKEQTEALTAKVEDLKIVVEKRQDKKK